MLDAVFFGASKAFLSPRIDALAHGPHTMDEPPKCGGCEMKLRNAAGFTFRRWRTNDARQGSTGVVEPMREAHMEPLEMARRRRKESEKTMKRVKFHNDKNRRYLNIRYDFRWVSIYIQYSYKLEDTWVHRRYNSMLAILYEAPGWVILTLVPL